MSVKQITLNISIEKGDPYLLEKMVRTWLTMDGQFMLFGNTGLDMEYAEEDECEQRNEKEAREWDHADYELYCRSAEKLKEELEKNRYHFGMKG